MKTNFFLVLLFLFSTIALSAQTPNVVVIIADDMGWSQVSTGLTNLNNPSDFYETPTLETLASEGIAFPYGYVNGANCAPTRAAMLSGQYPSRPTNNIFAVDNLNRGGNSTLLIGPDNGLPSGIDELPVAAITLAETIKTAGYSTVHLGKYHVGENESTNNTNNAATDQGFDTNYGGGTKGAPGSYFASGSPGNYTFHSNIGPELDPYADPYTLAESIALSVNGDNALEGTSKHVTDAMADAAIDWMNANNSNPFFMHFSNFAIHGPFNQANARPDLYAKYAAKPPSQMGHNNLGQAAIAEGMDQTIGRLIDYLKTTPDPRNPGFMLSENTLVYFLADNGGAIGTDDNGPLRAMKGEYYEGGIRSATIAWSEAPWLANKGTINVTPVIGFDLYPTLVEMAGGNLPGGYDIDGVSLWSMLNGTNANLGRDVIVWHFPGYLIDSNRDQRPVTVVRKGDHKLIHNYETASYELYHLINDIGETTNLLSGSPNQVTIDLANDMITDMRDHLIQKSSPLPTYRSNGQTVPLPDFISSSGSNSTDGCQAVSGYAAYWDFDTVEGANDASGNGNNPNPINGTLTYDDIDFVEGDQSVIFDGSVDINYSSATFISQATSSRTITAWIKPTNISGIQEIFDEGGNTVGIGMRLNGSSLESVVRSTLSISDNLSATFPDDSDWHHIALVYDGANTSHKLYIDGVEVASSSSAPASIGSHNATGGGIGGVIGSWDSFANTADSYFIGKMDAFSVYDTVLSSVDIETSACISTGGNSTAGCQASTGFEAYWDFDIANSVIGADISGNAHDPYATVGVITGDSADFKEGDQSAVFNGSSSIQYAQNGNGTFMINAHNARTVMAWVKPNSLSGLQNIFDEGGGTIGVAMRLNGSNLESVVRDSGSTSIEISTVFPNDGDWHHIALVYDGTNTNQKLYIDGVESASGSAASSIATHTGKGGIGGKISGNDSFGNSLDAFFTGKMDAFAVYEYAADVTEIETSACSNQVVADAGPDITICEGTSTILTASGGSTYLWSTGETTANITVNPITTTTYTVTVFEGTLSDQDDVIVTVNSLPIADAGTDVAICDGDSTVLIASGGDTYLWSTGETTASITVSPNTTTLYTVIATTNGCSDNDDVTVTVGALPTADAGSDEIICLGESTTLTASGGGMYLWSTGETTASIIVSPALTTNYSVTVTQNGCSENDDVTVTVNSVPLADAGADVAICSGDSTTLTATGGDTYMWSTGETSASIVVSPISTTVYSVTAILNGCVLTDQDDVIVTVNSLPTADAGTDVTICDGDSTTLVASGGDTYLWSTGETTASIIVSPGVTTTYTVTATTNGCSDNDDVTVTVDALPTADAGLDVTIDEGNSTTLTASGGGTYLWNTGETSASIVVSPILTTNYTVTVTLNGCSSDDSVLVTVNSSGCSYSIINTEGFESGWGIWNDGGSDCRRSSNDAFYANTGVYCMRLRDNTSTSVGTTDNLDLTAYEELTVDFSYYPRSMDNNNEDFWLQISTNGGSSYTTVEEWNRDDEFVNDQRYFDQVVIAGPFTSNTRLRFRADASGNSDWVYIDDIVISGCSSSPPAPIVNNDVNDIVTVESSEFNINKLSVKFYPNPFENSFKIKVKGNYEAINVKVFNLIGQPVFQYNNKGYLEEILVPLGDLPSGQYLIKLNIDGEIIFKRVLKR